MKDRVSANPGRVKLTPEDGSPAFYATMERADNPTEEGTPLNKSTLLSDAACDLLEIPQTSTPNEAFLKLAIGVGKYGYTVHFQWPDGSPMVGYQVSGLTAIDGSDLTTDDTGTVFGVSTASQITVWLNHNKYVDIDAAGGNLVSTGMITEGTFKAPVRSGTFPYIDSSRTCVFSQWAPLVDICAVGGGGSGGVSRSDGSNGPVRVNAASGGAGGYVNVRKNYNPAGKTLAITIGAGGSSVSSSSSNIYRNGNAGGTTSVTADSVTLVSANGGNGGRANQESAAWTDSASVYAQGVNGGSGSGRAGASARGTGYDLPEEANAYVNESGADGADGGSGDVYEGKGQGTTTTFAGVMYSSAGGGAAYAISDSSDVPSQEAETPGATGAGAGHVDANGGAGTTKGAGGGGAVSTSSTNFRSGAGAAGRVIIEVA